MTEKELLAVACEQFLGKNVQDIKNVVLQTLEGHLRSILGTLTVEQIYQDRDQFAKLVREVAAPDVGRMGIEILSFTIKVRCSRKAVPCVHLGDGYLVGGTPLYLRLPPGTPVPPSFHRTFMTK